MEGVLVSENLRGRLRSWHLQSTSTFKLKQEGNIGNLQNVLACLL